MRYGIKSSKFGVRSSGLGIRGLMAGKFLKNLLLLLVTVLWVVFYLQSFALGDEKWAGIDESVVEKVAKEHGREAKGPLINTDQGDLLLFVFLLAGAVGGFAAGYYWRILMVEKASKIPGSKEVIKG
jgi:ABC-type cobalt transport system substrate-binding protein